MGNGMTQRQQEEFNNLFDNLDCTEAILFERLKDGLWELQEILKGDYLHIKILDAQKGIKGLDRVITNYLAPSVQHEL